MFAFKGRNGLGNVFVWASGNGGRRGDSCAADGYVSSIYTLAVSSVTEHNTQPWYLEKCAAILVSTYSSGGPGASGIVSFLVLSPFVSWIPHFLIDNRVRQRRIF